MKIIHLTTTDSGGAGLAVLRLNDMMMNSGHESKVIIFNKIMQEENEFVVDITKSKPLLFVLKGFRKIFHEFQKKFNHKLIAKYLFHNYSEKRLYIGTKFIIDKFPFNPDIIVVHFLTHFMNMRNIYELQKKTNAKIIFTLMDMSPLTGGCHYAWDCTRYTKSCGKCPALSSNDYNDNSFKNLQYKAHYLSKINSILVSSTEWGSKQAMNSTLFKDIPVKKIFLSIDETVFKPCNKTILREKFGIAPNRKIIFIGAQQIEYERKGFKYLFDAFFELHNKLEGEKSNQILILTAGNRNISQNIPFEVLHLGVLKGDNNLVSAYQLSDVFVCSSIEDSGPMMINEAIMSGTPVVSFEMGVSLDFVSSKTGYIARNRDSSDLANGIYKVLFDYQLDETSINCRNLGLTKFSRNIISQKWEEVLSI